MMIFKSERVLCKGTNVFGNETYLIYRPAGHYPAGSVSVYQDDSFYVSSEFDGARHGRVFKNFADAENMFDGQVFT